MGSIKDKILEVYNRIEGQLELKQDCLTQEQLTNINLVSGKADLSDLRYSLVEPSKSTSGTTVYVTLQDRAINLVQLGSAITQVNMTFPGKISGKGRDFFVRLVVTGSSAPELSFQETTGVAPTFDTDDDSWADIQPGVNIILFSETNQ